MSEKGLGDELQTLASTSSSASSPKCTLTSTTAGGGQPDTTLTSIGVLAALVILLVAAVWNSGTREVEVGR